MTQRRLIFHIGPYKTGTSAIQETLSSRRAGLDGAGIIYPDSPRIKKPLPFHHSLAKQMMDPVPSDADALYGPDDLAELLRTTEAPCVVVSSESFSNRKLSPDRIGEAAAIARENGFETVAVAFIREQAELINSHYIQGVKHFKYLMPFAQFAREHDRHIQVGLDDGFGPWRDRDDVRFVPVPYVGATRGKVIAETMLRAAGVPDATVAAAGVQVVGRANENSGRMTVAAFRLAAREQPLVVKLPRRVRRHVMELALTLAQTRGWFADRFSGFDEAGAAAIRRRYADSNDAFARQYWGRGWAEVFGAEPTIAWSGNEIAVEDLNRLPRADADALMAVARELGEFAASLPEHEEARARSAKPLRAARIKAMGESAAPAADPPRTDGAARADRVKRSAASEPTAAMANADHRTSAPKKEPDPVRRAAKRAERQRLRAARDQRRDD